MAQGEPYQLKRFVFKFTVFGPMKKFLSLKSVLVSLLAVTSLATADSAPYMRTQAERDAMTPEQVLQSFKDGNERFLTGTQRARNFRQEQMATKGGQHPASVLLSCIDSRAPAEVIFDKGIGEMFNARLAGNVANPDIVGSMEFACAAAGAKLILVLGHSSCGAVNGAIDHVELGNLTGLLDRIHPAVVASKEDHAGPFESSNTKFAEAVTRENVVLTVEKIRRLSPLLRDMEESGDIMIVGGLYNLETGKVEFLK
jgi:carbonic anhydrase